LASEEVAGACGLRPVGYLGGRKEAAESSERVRAVVGYWVHQGGYEYDGLGWAKIGEYKWRKTFILFSDSSQKNYIVFRLEYVVINCQVLFHRNMEISKA
jgi:hypothetical protein